MHATHARFGESNDNFSIKEDYVLPPDGHHLPLDNSKLKTLTCEDSGGDSLCGNRLQCGAGGWRQYTTYFQYLKNTFSIMPFQATLRRKCSWLPKASRSRDASPSDENSLHGSF